MRRECSRKQHEEELHNLYPFRMIEAKREVRMCSTYGRDEKCIRNCGQKPEGKRT
jgi:hypothetical protein